MRSEQFSSLTLLDESREITQVDTPLELPESIVADQLIGTLNALTTPLWTIDLDGRCLFANPAACETFGYSQIESLGRRLQCRLHTCHDEEWHCPKDRCPIQKALEAGVATELADETFLRRDGTPMRVRCTVDPLLLHGKRAGAVISLTDITSQKSAEDALRRSDEWLGFAQHLGAIGMFDLDLKTGEVRASEAQLRMCGLDPAEKLPGPEAWLDLIHPDDRERMTHQINVAVSEGRTTATEFRIVWPDGSVHWLFGQATRQCDKAGRPERLMGANVDITERKMAEESARKSGEWLKFTLEASGIGLCYRESGVTRASEHQFRLYGLEPEPSWVSRERWLELIHPGDRERVLLEQRRAGEANRLYDIQFRVVWPDGSTHWLLCRGKNFLDGDGIGRTEITMDITRRKQAELALENFFSVSHSPMCILDFNARITRMNDALVRASGYTAEELTTQPVLGFFHPEDRPIISARIKRLIAEGGQTEFESRYLRKDGSTVWLYFSAAASADEKQIFTVAHDITELKRLAADLETHVKRLARSNTDLEQFAYIASHDLQEPLRMVASFTQLLSQRYAGRLDETADRYIYYSVDGAKRMQLLISDLLSYSRVNSKQLDLQKVDCRVIVETAVQDLRAAIQETGAVVEWGELPHLWLDPTQAVQLFQNLLGNAMKFRRKHVPPRICISAQERQAEFLLSVADNGIGIEPQHTERIFQVFQRLHNREQFPGTGIGLAVCKRVVERHGGTIWVQSRPGEGSTFYFTIPKRD